MVRRTSDSCVLIAHEFFTILERQQSSTYVEQATLLRCFVSFVALCAGAMVIILTDSRSLTFIVNRGSQSTYVNDLAVKLHEFCIVHNIVLEI
jgi:hypothetical protein